MLILFKGTQKWFKCKHGITILKIIQYKTMTLTKSFNIST